MIVIDPGHGGREPRGKSTPYGQRCHDGRWEKDVTLSLANAVARRLGDPVRLTRTGDVNLSLGERTDVARSSGANAFLSLHVDQNGSRVWTHPRGGQPARALARSIESELGQIVSLAPRRDDVELAVLAPDRLGAHTAGALVELATPIPIEAVSAGIARALSTWRRSLGRRYGRVSPLHVDCEALQPRSGYPIFRAIGTDDPVGAISDAVDKAVALIDTTTNELDDARARVANGEALPVLRDPVARSLRARLLIDPDRPATYTGTGPNTLEIVVRWLSNCRRILDGDEIGYTCLGREEGANPACVPGRFARTVGCDSAAGQCASHITLCRDWWHPLPEPADPAAVLEERALTLIHESTHIFYNTDDVHQNPDGTTSRVFGPGASHCLTLFVADVNGIPNRNHAGRCGEDQ